MTITQDLRDTAGRPVPEAIEEAARDAADAPARLKRQRSSVLSLPAGPLTAATALRWAVAASQFTASPTTRNEARRHVEVAIAHLGEQHLLQDLVADFPAASLALVQAIAEATRDELVAIASGKEPADSPSSLASRLRDLGTDAEGAEGEDEGWDDEGDDTPSPQSIPTDRRAIVARRLGRTLRREMAAAMVRNIQTVLNVACRFYPIPEARRGLGEVKQAENFAELVRKTWDTTFPDWHLSSKPLRERYDRTELLRLIAVLFDPRAYMYAVLASVTNGSYAEEARWNDLVQRPGKGLCLRYRASLHQTVDGFVTYRAFSAEARVVFDKILAAGYRQQFFGGEPASDDFIMPRGRWTGEPTQPFRRSTTPFRLDPRAQLLYTLGAERRHGPLSRVMRSQLTWLEQERCHMLTTPDRRRKRGFSMLLAPSQEAWLVFALEFGYLRDLEREWRASGTDYYLFQSGKLKGGRLVPQNGKASHVNRRTLIDWARQLEEQAEVTRKDGCSNYGLRRALADLLDELKCPAPIADAITQHAQTNDGAQETADTTRVTTYVDSKRLEVLRAQREWLERVRSMVPDNEPPSVGGSEA